MKLSIIVPIYRVEDCLERCLSSFQNNVSKDFEVIMVDDGSPDSSGIIADNYSKKYSNYHSFHKENGGLSDARNYGLDFAQGDFIWFVDSDDYLIDGAIDEFFKINSKTMCDVYCFTIEKHYPDNKIEYISYNYTAKIMNGHDFLYYQYKKHDFRPEAWRNIYKKSLLLTDEDKFVKGILHEDDEWTPRTLIKAQSIFVSKFSAYAYIVRENSIMKQGKFDRHIESVDYMINKYESMSFNIDKSLKKLILDRMINNYLSIFSKGQFYNNKKYFKKYNYFKGKQVFLKTKIKVCIYCLSKRLFCKMSRMINK